MKKLLLIAVFVAFTFVNALAKESPETILRSLPSQISSYSATDIVPYEDVRLGASLGYNHPAGIVVTLYLYDLGEKDIREGIDSEIIAASKDMAVADIREAEKMGYYGKVTVVSDAMKTLKLSGGREIKLLFLSLTYLLNNPNTGESSPVASDLYLTGLRGFICKVRISRPSGLGKTDEDGIAEMLNDLLSALKR